MIKYIYKLSLSARLNLLIISLILIIFSVFGIYLYYNQKRALVQEVDAQINQHLSDISAIIDYNLEDKAKLVKTNMAVAKYMLSRNYMLSMSDSISIQVSALRPEDNSLFTINIPQFEIDGMAIYNNFNYVDNMRDITNGTYAIFQKFDSGYVCISSNIYGADKTRTIGQIIPLNSPIIKQIESGIPFSGELMLSNDKYIAAIEPLDILGQVNGMLFTGVKERDVTFLEGLLRSKKFYQTGVPFLISANGKFIVSPINENTDILENSRYIKEITSQKKGSLVYKTSNKNSKILYFIPNKSLDAFIAVDFYEKEVFSGMTRLRIILFLGVLVIIIVLIIGVNYATKSINKILNKLIEVLAKLAKGEEAQKIEYAKKDEIGQIIGSLNQLIEGLEQTSTFADQIGKGNLQSEFTPLSENDVLGNSLLEMRQSLKVAKEEEEKRRQEDEKANWATKGLAVFGDILRLNNDDLEKLSYEIVRSLVKYTNINQGAIFLINDEDPNDVFLEMKACYAYERRKYIEARLEVGEGLVGACYMERKTKYLQNVPIDYINITSGLGYAPPSEILMVPLVLNEETFGVIELASFDKFERYKIEFVEKIAASVASTISSVKINLHTAILLKKSQQQAEIMKAQEEDMRLSMEELQIAKEEAARQGEQLEIITNTVNQTLIRAEYDTAGHLINANLKFLNKLGYSTLGEVENKSIFSFIHEKDKKWFTETWNNLLNGEDYFEGNIKHITKQGKEFWAMATYTCIRKSEDFIDKILFLGIDNTSDTKRNLTNNSQISALDHSIIKAEYMIDGSLQAWNDKFKKFMGYNNDEDLKGKTIYDFIYDDDLSKAKEIWKIISSGEAYEGQIRLDTNKGEKWFQAVFAPLKDIYGDIDKVVCIGNDISRQKQQERELKFSKILFEKTFDNSADAIVSIDESLAITFFNKSSENLWEFKKSEIIGKDFQELFPSEYAGDPMFLDNYIVKGLNIRKEMTIQNSRKIKFPVNILFIETKVGETKIYTAFIQKIETEIF